MAGDQRPLRQVHGRVALEIEVPGDEVVGAWRSLRERTLDELTDLDDTDWTHPSRCEHWSCKDVVAHLITTDLFWSTSIDAAIEGHPSTILAGFDPVAHPHALVAQMQSLTGAEILARFTESTRQVRQAVDRMGDRYELPGESPVGHVPLRLVLTHAFWDAWAHERDILVPLSRASDPDPDELRIVAAYCLGGAGLLGRPAEGEVAAGESPPMHIDSTIHLTGPGGAWWRLQVDNRSRLTACEPTGTPDLEHDTLAIVEFALGRDGRQPPPAANAQLMAYFERAQRVF